jgi:hypothetical protein
MVPSGEHHPLKLMVSAKEATEAACSGLKGFPVTIT